MGLGSSIDSKIVFLGDLIFESVAWFYVIILNFIFTPIFEIKNHEKNSLTPKKFQKFFFRNSWFCSIIDWHYDWRSWKIFKDVRIRKVGNNRHFWATRNVHFKHVRTLTLKTSSYLYIISLKSLPRKVNLVIKFIENVLEFWKLCI